MKLIPALLCCFLSVPVGFGCASATGPVPPDVFLVTIDTLRADHVHCYGDENILTPALDKLAKDGIRFTQAFTPSPLTNTSHTTILTGLLPSSHGVRDFGAPLDPSHRTLAELLKLQGYKTAAFIGAVVLDSKTLAPGLDQGFDFYDNFPAHPAGASRWGRVERRGMDVVHHAETWLSAHPAGPHFVWVHLYDPHDPYEPPPPYSEIYKDRLYDGEIAYADSALGNLIAYLQQVKRYQQSLIIVVGDHGEGLGEHNEQTHGIFLYDSTTHVPLIVKLPGDVHHTVAIEVQVRTTDILPTVLDVLHLPPAMPLDGASLVPYFSGDETSGRTLFGETDYPLSFGWAPLRSVRDGGFKFIEAPRPELYDLGADPREMNSLYEARSSTVIKMQGQLAALRQGYPAFAALGKGTALPDPKDKIAEQNLLHAALLAKDDLRIADAQASLEKVLQMDPQSLSALTQLGEIELNAGNYGRAAEDLRRAVALKPDDAMNAFNYGKALHLAGDDKGAVGSLQASLKANPSQYQARFLLGEIYFRLHDNKDAQDQLEAALLLQPSVEATLKLAELMIAQARYSEAVEALTPITAQASHNAQLYDMLAAAYTGLHKKEAAQKAQQRADFLRANNGKR